MSGGFLASRVFGKALKLLFGADVQSERFEGVKELAADSGGSARLCLPFSLIVCWNGGRLCFSRLYRIQTARLCGILMFLNRQGEGGRDMEKIGQLILLRLLSMLEET